jgi:protein involved in polysaccharide export with SLBB domain
MKLPVHEWLIIILFCSILTLLAGMAILRQQYSQPNKVKFTPESPITALEVKIVGAVAKPGHYRFPLNALLNDLLDQAEPLPKADLSKIKGRRKLRDGQTIHIPERTWITVNIEGAVQRPGPLKILSGTRYQEIIDKLELLPDADIKTLRKKRQFLQEGDLVKIPTKKAKNRKVYSNFFPLELRLELGY